MAGMQRYFQLVYDSVSYIHILSNITIVIEHDDNFDKSSLKFLASIRLSRLEISR